MDVDKLKYLMLDENQRIVFNSLPQPNLLSLVDKDSRINLFAFNTKYNSFTVIKNLLKIKSLNPNAKILKLHDKNITRLLEEWSFK
jgi:hypothetical protein